MATRELKQYSSPQWAIARALAAELRAWSAALRLPSLYVLLPALTLALLLAPQLPLRYGIDVGVGEGYGGDLPMLRGFNTPETDEHGSFRWTDDGAAVQLPGLGERLLRVQLDFFPISDAVVQAGPKTIEVWSGSRADAAGMERLALLPVQKAGSSYSLIVPPRASQGGDLTLLLRTATFAAPGDPRALGTPLDRITITALSRGVPATPDWGALGTWLLTALLAWVVVLRALGPIAGAWRWATLLLALAAALVAVAAALDPPRWAFGAWPALTALALGYGLLLLLRGLLPWLARHLAIPLDQRALGWLTLISVIAFALRYGGRLYPNAMHGDIGFHTNRFNEAVRGLIYIVSKNRGVDFPYPPAPYLLLAPFTLTGIDIPDLLQLAAALLDSLSAPLVYALAACGLQRTLASRPAAGAGDVAQPSIVPLLAATIYVFTAAGFMTTWWSFSTHIVTQFCTLLLVTALLLVGRPEGRRSPLAAGFLFVLLCLVFLGHFGFFINTALLLAWLLLLVWLQAWRGAAWARALRLPLTLLSAGALAFALVFFYSAYIPIFIAQAQVAAAGGLSAVAQRAPVSRAIMLEGLWDAGFVLHFGFFPLALALLSIGVIWSRRVLALMTGSFLVSTLFAIVPFITLATNSTRWLMFSAWAVAVGGALLAQWLWRRGWVGRIVVGAMAGYVLWNSALIWLGPMLWRIRPPEPF